MQIPDRSEGWFLAIFTLKIVVGTIAIVWIRPWASTTSVLELIAAAVVISAATTTIMTQGGAMLAERYLRRRYYEGKEEGREEGLEEGREEGRVEGREEGLREGSVKFAERLKNLSDKERQEEIDRPYLGNA